MIALREIAEKVIPANDMREGFINSLQGNAEVDEPEAAATPALPPAFRPPQLGLDDPALDHLQAQLTLPLGAVQHEVAAAMAHHAAAIGLSRAVARMQAT